MADEKDDGITRRQALAAGIAGAATLAALPVLAGERKSSERPDSKTRAPRPSGERMPVAFLPHGGGPWPFVDLGFPRDELDSLATYLRNVRVLPKTTPAALLVISAHWEEKVPTVMTAARPPMLYDYYGFPPESYQVTWPAPGDPRLAARVQQLLSKAGFQTAADERRGYDHGTFVPLKLTYPEAEIPTVQLSLKLGLDPAEHLAMGRALAPLRDEGVFIVGSGMTFHNMRAFGNGRAYVPVAESFESWLRETATLERKERDRRLVEWAATPGARACHPREAHLMPLMVIAGAAGDDRGMVDYSGTCMGLRISGFHFA